MVSTNVTQLLAAYIHALHILHFHEVLDGFGHLSVRNPKNSPTFFMQRQLAPALVSGPEDIGEYRISDAEPVYEGTPAAPVERFIHSEILKRYPGVNVVLHGHPDVLISYGISNVPLRAVTHMSGFLGERTPIYDITRYYLPNDTQDFLVRSERLGATLADVLGSSSCSLPGAAVKPTEGNGRDCDHHSDAGARYEEKHAIRYGRDGTGAYPAHNLALMKFHGFTAVATDIETATYEGVYAVTNAKVQSAALRLLHACTGSEARCDRDVVYLTPQQTRDSWATEALIVGKPWAQWVREVKADPLYVNELDL